MGELLVIFVRKVQIEIIL